jgi:hypothetical protein
MSASRKPYFPFSVLIISALILQNCLTITKGVSQRIPVTSNLRDARVSVDGKEIGTTPIHVVLQKNRDHVIRIERQGYTPVNVVMNRKSSAAASGRIGVSNALLFFPVGFILAGGLSSLFFDMGVHGSAGPYVIGTLAGVGLTLGAISVDNKSDARYSFSPAELKVALTRTGTHIPITTRKIRSEMNHDRSLKLATWTLVS